MQKYDVVIVGGGMGGLVSAALLSHSGISTLLLEQHSMPGGCCASFVRDGYLFEAGATVGCGFHPGGPMDWLGNRLGLHWPVTRLPVAWEYLDGDLCLQLDANRRSLLKEFPDSHGFWREQEVVADNLWAFTWLLLEQYSGSRPKQLFELSQYLVSKMVSPKLLRLMASPAGSWLRAHGLATDYRLRRFIDAQLLISAQAPLEQSNGLFSALALDLPRREPCHISGGVGTIAAMLSACIQEQGGRVRLGEKVVQLEARGGKIKEVITSRGRYGCKQLVFNGSSATLASLLGRTVTDSWSRDNRAAWGAFIVHLGLDRNLLSGRSSPYLQMLQPAGDKFGECGSLFLSIPKVSTIAEATASQPGLTVSTHTEVGPWWEAYRAGSCHYSARKQEYTDKILTLLTHYLGEFRQSVNVVFTGTPVTYARYTGRFLGLVGGYAQTRVLPPKGNTFGMKNLWMVGDHSFPGQSMAGVTVGAALKVDGLLRKF